MDMSVKVKCDFKARRVFKHPVAFLCDKCFRQIRVHRPEDLRVIAKDGPLWSPEEATEGHPLKNLPCSLCLTSTEHPTPLEIPNV